MRSKRIFFLIISLVALWIKNSSGQAYAGGPKSGTSSIVNTCPASSYFSVFAGGFYDGSSAGINACPASSYFSVVAGGSYDGSSAGINACPASSYFSVVAGGFYDGSSVVVNACPASNYFSVTAGGSYDGTSVAINSCNSLNSAVSSVSTSCSPCNGSASVTAIGGTPPYTYSWSNGATTNSATGLCAGSYTVTVVDASSNTKTSNVSVAQGTILSASASSGAINCNGGTTTVTVAAAGGAPSYTGTGNFTQSAGNYNYTVTDSRGCTASASINVTEPTALTASSSLNGAILCNGQTTTVTVSGSGGTPSYNGTGTFTVSAGSYNYTITDAGGCIATASGSVTEPTALSVSVSSNQPICRTSNLNLSSTVAGGTGAYTYSWSGPNGYSSTDANNSFVVTTTAYTGTYSLIVTDFNNCTATTAIFVEVNDCNTTLNLTLFIQGYYVGSSLMRPVMANEQACTGCSSLTDSIFIILHNVTSPYAITDSIRTLVNTNGTTTHDFPPALNGQTRYIEVRHRNSIQTWSAAPVTFALVNSYDFTSAPASAFGNNLIKVDVPLDKWALFSGNLNQDQNIDLIDFPVLDFGINQGLFGYHRSDMNGDGNTDLLDFPVLDGNINTGVFSRHP